MKKEGSRGQLKVSTISSIHQFLAGHNINGRRPRRARAGREKKIRRALSLGKKKFRHWMIRVSNETTFHSYEFSTWEVSLFETIEMEAKKACRELWLKIFDFYEGRIIVRIIWKNSKKSSNIFHFQLQHFEKRSLPWWKNIKVIIIIRDWKFFNNFLFDRVIKDHISYYSMDH